MSTPPAPDRPHSAHLEFLLRLRFAEAFLAAREAEDIVAHWASVEAQLAAAEDAEASVRQRT
jgi:hypothetical protein